MTNGWGRTEFQLGTEKDSLKRRLSGHQTGDLQLHQKSTSVLSSFPNSLRLKKRAGGTDHVHQRRITAKKLFWMTETWARTKVLFSMTRNA